MIRLLIKEYTLKEKIALYGAIAGRYGKVIKDMDRARYWLEK